MALTILSTDQKETLLGNAEFAKQTKWAVLNKAQYWSGLDGTSVPGNNWERWRKSKNFALTILANPSIAESFEIVKKFMNLAKNVACVDDAVTDFNDAAQQTVISYLLNDGGSPAVNNFDSFADAWFDDQIATNL